ncbi:MAG: gamma-glutamyl-gamma-aminobutyrate hydrolase family protein [Dehalococcoidia bacterium]
MPDPTERPRIGVTLSSRYSPRTQQNYLGAVERAGADAEALFHDRPGDLQKVAELDGLVLSGGGDVNPDRYGEPRHPEVESVDDALDDFEFRAFDLALARNLPILAICRGHQLVNIALGGRLVQHIESGTHRAGGPGGKAPSAWHTVDLLDSSRLGDVYAAARITTNSRHHQGIVEGMLADGLTATGWTEDGFIEAYEGPQAGGIIGVQWHPERVEEDARGGFNEQSAKLFRFYVDQMVRSARPAELTRK